MHNGEFGQSITHSESTKKWLAQYLATDGERENWVRGPLGLIKKASLTLVDKFLWLLAQHRLSPMLVDNVVTWDRAVLVVSLVARLEIDFARVLILVIHERVFKTFATYTFAYLIFMLCRDTSVLIWT